jgi:hypothetical protein
VILDQMDFEKAPSHKGLASMRSQFGFGGEFNDLERLLNEDGSQPMGAGWS